MEHHAALGAFLYQRAAKDSVGTATKDVFRCPDCNGEFTRGDPAPQVGVRNQVKFNAS